MLTVLGWHGKGSFTAQGTYCLIREGVSVSCWSKMSLGQQTTGLGTNEVSRDAVEIVEIGK